MTKVSHSHCTERKVEQRPRQHEGDVKAEIRTQGSLYPVILLRVDNNASLCNLNKSGHLKTAAYTTIVF